MAAPHKVYERPTRTNLAKRHIVALRWYCRLNGMTRNQAIRYALDRLLFPDEVSPDAPKPKAS